MTNDILSSDASALAAAVRERRITARDAVIATE